MKSMKNFSNNYREGKKREIFLQGGDEDSPLSHIGDKTETKKIFST